MRYFFTFYSLIWLLYPSLYADPIITFFFQEYPTVTLGSLPKKLRKPHGIAKQTLNGFFNKKLISGIFSTYFGFLNVSDQNGQTSFPRKQSSALLKVIITNKITPIVMFQYTISHWELVPGAPAEMYQCEQKEDETTKLIFWDIQKVPLPENKQIPLQDALIIIAKPHNIVIPPGVSLTQKNANLILPKMYVKKEIQTSKNALYMLDLSLFFRPIDILYKKEKKSYETLVNE